MVASGGLQGPASATATYIYAGKEKQMQTAAACRKESPTAKRLMHGPDNPDIHAVSRWQSGLQRTEAGISSSVTSAGLIAADPAIIMLRGLEEGDGVLHLQHPTKPLHLLNSAQESTHPLACRWLIG